MKTRIILCFLFIAVFFTGQSLAKIADSDKDVKALTFFASEQSWPLLINGAIKSGSYIDCKSGKPSGKCVTFDFLTKGMYAHAKGNAHVMELVKPENRTESAYIKLTRSQNNMPETGGAIPLEDLRELVFNPDKGIVYAREVDPEIKTQVAQATQSVQADATPAITVRPLVKPLEASKPSEAEAQISNLKNQIAEMKKAFAGGNADAKKRLATLEKSLNDLAENVESVGKGQKDLAQNQVKISASMEEIAGALAELKNQNNATKSGIYEDIKAMADAVEHNQMIIVIIVISLSVVIVLLSLYFWFTNRSTRKIANEAKGIAEKADGKAGFATSLVKKQEADLGLVIESVDELLAVDSDDCKGLFICDEAKLSKEFTMNLPVGESIEVIVRFSEKDWRIIFFRASETHFNVSGIRRTKSAKSSEMDVGYLTNLADFIRKAYKDHRISAKEVEEAIAA